MPRDPEVLGAHRAAEPWRDRVREAEPAAWAPRGGRVPAAESPFGTSQGRAWRQITPFPVSRSVGDLRHGRAGRMPRTIRSISKRQAPFRDWVQRHMEITPTYLGFAAILLVSLVSHLRRMRRQEAAGRAAAERGQLVSEGPRAQHPH